MSDSVIVVGAGVAGLTAAYRLRKAGLDVTVLEAEDHVGGRMVTVERDGFRMDTGAYLLSRKYDRMLALIAEVGLATSVLDGSDLLGIVRDGTIHRVGGSPWDAVRTGVLSWRAKLAAVKLALDARRLGDRLDWFDLSRAAEVDTESARDYTLRRGNAELLDYLVDPAMGVCYMESPERISTVDLLFAVNNFFGGGLFNLAGGVGELCSRLAENVDVRLGARATGIEEKPDGVTISWEADGQPERTVDAAACVITLGAREMVGIYPQLSAHLQDAISRLRYVRYMPVKLALAKKPAEPALAVLVPRREDADLCAIELDHNKLPASCPPGKAMASAYFHVNWVESMWNAPDDDIIELAIKSCGSVLGDIGENVEFGHVVRWDPAWVLPAPGGYSDLRQIAQSRTTARRVHLAGDYLGGSTTNSALCSGERAAEHLLAALEIP